MLPQLESEQIKVVAGSVDTIEKAKEIVEKLGITYPIGYGMNLEAMAKLIGAFYEKERKILHATDFLLRPDKTIAVASYSSGAIGRFVAQDVIKLVKFYKSKK
jgi:peroxiredoxin